MEIGLITSERAVSPLVRLTGPQQDGSEVCGVVFDPSGKRMYCTSQRAGGVGGAPGPGAVYEISGPFGTPRGGLPRDFAYGPPAGEARPSGPLNPGADGRRPAVTAKAAKAVGRTGLTKKGLAVRVDADEAATVSITLDSLDLASVKGRGGSTRRPKRVKLASAETRARAAGRAGRGAAQAGPPRPPRAGPAAQERARPGAGQRPRRRGQRAHGRPHGQGGRGQAPRARSAADRQP